MEGSLRMKSFSNTRWLSFDPKELCDSLKVLLQMQQAGTYSKINGEEALALVDKLLEYKCTSTKQDRLLILNVHAKWKIWSWFKNPKM